MVASGWRTVVRGLARWVALSGVVAVVGCGGSSRRTGDDDSPNDAGSGGSGTGGKGAAQGGTGGAATGGTATGGTATAGTATAGAAASNGVDPTKTLVQIRPAVTQKLDLLLMIDNSLSMGDKQQLLAEAMPVLTSRLLQPACVDADGNVSGQASAQNPCPSGTAPEFAPIKNLHVGVITSSLGDHGSGDVCSQAQNAANVARGGQASDYDDLAELLPSVRTGLASWNNSGFLVWDPRDQTQVSDRHENLTQNETDANAFVTNLVNQVTAAGERGCGYEASLESWYRFLVDPEPVATMTHDNVAATGVRGPINGVVLAQRAAFLRPDSILMIVMLSDENDCSIADEDNTQGWLVGYMGGVEGSALWHMPRASSACAADPNDVCCRPCPSNPSPGCPADAADAACSQGSTLPLNEDSMNLRCYHQVQRFGIDLLYPTGRYTEALTRAVVQPRFGGGSVPNPLFAIGPNNEPPREPGMVIFGGILGVPWQDLATEASWNGDGLEYLEASELEAEGRWDVMLGDPATHRLPTDALMIESVDARTDLPYPQEHPLIAAKLGPPDSTTLTNPINGHEQAARAVRDDLQHACIFELSLPVACNDTNVETCECTAADYATNSPLCTRWTATSDGMQVYGKAYPSLRQLEVLKSFGENAVVASICPKSTTPRAGSTTATDPSYGYNPAVSALVAKLPPLLKPRCLPLELPVADGSSRAACTVLEARVGERICACNLPGRADASNGAVQAARKQLATNGLCDQRTGPACDDFCVCEIQQFDGAELDHCQTDASDSGSDYGFCYIDPERGLGSDAIVASCDESSRRVLRFLGDGVPQKDAVTFLDCTAQ